MPLAQGEAGVGQLVLGHGIEDVALIFAPVQCLFQNIAPAGLVLDDAGVVPGDDLGEALLTGQR